MSLLLLHFPSVMPSLQLLWPLATLNLSSVLS